MTISLPLGRPVTQTYDVESGTSKFYDDGKIPGAVTLRSLVYGDEAMFESFEEFAARLRLPVNANLSSSRYFCAVPLRVNQTIVGTMMLTSFDDDGIRRAKQSRSGNFMNEDREMIHLVGSKRWTIFPPQDAPYLYMSFVSASPGGDFATSAVDLRNPDLERFPAFASAHPITFELHAGEMLYLPMGWSHFVENLELSLMVNYWLSVKPSGIAALDPVYPRQTRKRIIMDFIKKIV